MPSGFYWGGFGQSLGQGLTNIGKMLAEKGQLDEQRKESELRRKMLDLQIQKATREQSEAETRDRLLSDIATSMSQPVGQSIFQGVEEEGAGLAGPPAAPTRPKTLEDIKNDPTILGKLAQVQPKEFATGLMKKMMPGSSGGLVRDGYKTPQEAILATRAAGMPVARVKQGVDGLWRAEGSEPVNYGALLAQGAKARVLQQGGTPEQAEAAGLAAANLYQYQQRGYGAMGGLEAELTPQGSPLPSPPGISAPSQPLPAPSTVNQLGTPATPPLGPVRFDSSLSPQDRAALEAQGIRETTLPPSGPYPTQAGGPPVQRRSFIQEKEIQKTQARIQTELQNKTLPPELQRQFNSLNISLQNADTVSKTFKPDYVGSGLPVSMRDWNNVVKHSLQRGEDGVLKYVPGALVAQLEQRLGTLTNPEQARFYRAVMDMQDQFLRGRSGAQINEQEFARLVRASVNIFSSPEQFKASFNDFTKITRDTADQILKSATTPATQLQVAPAPQIGGRPPPPPGYRYVNPAPGPAPSVTGEY